MLAPPHAAGAVLHPGWAGRRGRGRAGRGTVCRPHRRGAVCRWAARATLLSRACPSRLPAADATRSSRVPCLPAPVGDWDHVGQLKSCWLRWHRGQTSTAVRLAVQLPQHVASSTHASAWNVLDGQCEATPSFSPPPRRVCPAAAAAGRGGGHHLCQLAHPTVVRGAAGRPAVQGAGPRRPPCTVGYPAHAGCAPAAS